MNWDWLGVSPYLTVYPSSRHDTDTISFQIRKANKKLSIKVSAFGLEWELFKDSGGRSWGARLDHTYTQKNPKKTKHIIW